MQLLRISDPKLSPRFFIKMVVALVVLGGMFEILHFIVLEGLAIYLFLLLLYWLCQSSLTTGAFVRDLLFIKLFTFVNDHHLKATDVGVALVRVYFKLLAHINLRLALSQQLVERDFEMTV